MGVIITTAVENLTSSKKSKTSQRIQSLIRPTKKSSNMFASLLVFFTQEWNISLKHLFAAEWGVFAGLQFRLKANPSDVAFHFRRLMKTLGYDPRRYLGSQVYGYWQQALTEEEFRRQEWEARIETRRQRKEQKKLKQLQREIEAADRRDIGSSEDGSVLDKIDEKDGGDNRIKAGDILDERKGLPPQATKNMKRRRRRGLGDILKNRLGGGNAAALPKRSDSTERSWTRRRGSGETGTAINRPMMTTPAIKNTPTSAAAVGSFKQRPRSPLLRPLSNSKSMLSLTTKGREMLGKNIFIDDMPQNKNSLISLHNLVEEDGNTEGRRRGSKKIISGGDTNDDKDDTRSVDGEEGIMI